MKRLLIHIIARYYLWKFRRQETNPKAKWQMRVAKTGSIYLLRKCSKGTYKRKLRISDHPPKNKQGNPRTKHSKKRGIVI